MDARISNNEVSIRGTFEELGTVEQVISEFSKSAEGKLEISFSSVGDPKPYDGFLDSMILKKNSGAILVDSVGCILQVTASADNMDVFSSYFLFTADEEHKSHNHLSYFEGDVYIDSESISLVVVLEAN